MKRFKHAITLAAVVIAVVIASFGGGFFVPASSSVEIVQVSEFSDETKVEEEAELASTFGLHW